MAISANKYRQKYLRYHLQYERAAYKELQKVFHKWSRDISWDKMTESNYKGLIKEGILTADMMAAYIEIYSKVGTAHGVRVGKNINSQIKEAKKAFVPNQFTTTYLHDLVFYLQKYGMKRIVLVSDTYFNEINKLMQGRLAKGMSIEQASSELKKLVNKPNFYKWQAKRIARTESTAASNYAAQEAGKVSGYAMDKLWISGIDDRTRYDHNEANGQRVPNWQKFTVGGEKLDYPGDAAGSAANVINCRCSVAMQAARDKDGNLIELNGNTGAPSVINDTMPSIDSLDLTPAQLELLSSEVDAIEKYTTSFYQDINGLLRNNLTADEIEDVGGKEYLNRMISDINSGLQKLPDVKGVVYRGEKFDFRREELFNDIIAKMQPGGVMKQEAFLSTTTKEATMQTFGGANSDDYFGRILYTIESKSGKSIKHLSTYETEEEVLFKNSSSFLIKKVEKSTTQDNLYNVTLEEI